MPGYCYIYTNVLCLHTVNAVGVGVGVVMGVEVGVWFLVFHVHGSGYSLTMMLFCGMAS